jgi:hypothetical protein
MTEGVLYYKITASPSKCWFIVKELNPRRRVYVEIPKPARVELKLRQNPRRQQLSEVGHMLTVIRSVLCTETFSVRNKMAAIISSTREGFG